MPLAGVLSAQTPDVDWPSYNRTLTSERYTPLDQINRTNVSTLKQLCVFDLDVDANFQTGPIVIGRTLYATTDKEIFAMDAGTCQQKWRVREDGPSVGLAVNRGVAHLDGRLFRGTGEGDVIAYDAATGKKLWTTRLASREKGESIPSAPIAWSGLVFVGTAGSENYGVQGRMYALDARTGKVVWETYMVPTDAPQPGNEKMQAQARATWGNAERCPDYRRAARGRHIRSMRSEGCCTSPPAIPLRTSSTRCVLVPTSTPTRSSSSMRRPASTAITIRWCPPTSTIGICRPLRCWSQPGVANASSPERPKDGLLHVYDLATDRKLYAMPITTRENVETPLSTRATRFCPGAGWWHPMERAGLQPRNKSALHRNGGLVRDGDARSGPAQKEAGTTVDWCRAPRIHSANAISIGRDGSPPPMRTRGK